MGTARAPRANAPEKTMERGAAPMLRLETERLILRPFDSGDFDAVHSYAAVPENVKYMGWGPNDEGATEEFLQKCAEGWAQEPVLEHNFAVVLKENGAVIGGCGIYLNEGRDTGMLGWILHRDHWNRGYMTEAGEALLRFGFEGLALHRIYATCNSENSGSFRVMEKLGMRREAHFIKARHGRVGDKNEWYSEYHCAMLEQEWRERAGA